MFYSVHQYKELKFSDPCHNALKSETWLNICSSQNSREAATTTITSNKNACNAQALLVGYHSDLETFCKNGIFRSPIYYRMFSKLLLINMQDNLPKPPHSSFQKQLHKIYPTVQQEMSHGGGNFTICSKCYIPILTKISCN